MFDVHRPIHVVGPLEPYVHGFLDDLAGQGYAPWSMTSYLHLLEHLSRWLHDHDLGGAELTPQLLLDYLEEGRARGDAKARSVRGMTGVLTGFLSAVGAMPELAQSPPTTPLERLLEEFTAVPQHGHLLGRVLVATGREEEMDRLREARSRFSGILPFCWSM